MRTLNCIRTERGKQWSYYSFRLHTLGYDLPTAQSTTGPHIAHHKDNKINQSLYSRSVESEYKIILNIDDDSYDDGQWRRYLWGIGARAFLKFWKFCAFCSCCQLNCKNFKNYQRRTCRPNIFSSISPETC